MGVQIDVYDFVKQMNVLPVVDVRTVTEYSKGHIPNATHFPLFSDEERAEIGLIYKRMGRLQATQTGLEMVGPRLSEMIDRLREKVPVGSALVHCWRGGMRSESVAWLMGLSGLYKPLVLQGGYKAYRNFALGQFASERRLLILGGMTGSGKTRVLNLLMDSGGQGLDLEARAAHKGSAFGALGQPDPPTQQQFENDLAFGLFSTDPVRPLWLEDESRHIGRRTIPEELWARMRDAPVTVIERSREERVQSLVDDYGSFDPDKLRESIWKIERRLGGERARMASDAVAAGDLAAACGYVLDYYDQTYSHGLSRRNPDKVRRLEVTGMPDEQVVEILLETG